jgi:type I restriction enzyme R subunit
LPPEQEWFAPVTPEEKARQEIDRQLAACGWIVQDHKAMNIMAGPGVAVREFPLKTGYADYLLYVDGKVAGIIEAKPEGHTLTGVEVQSSKYTLGLPDAVPHYRKPLPFAYESTGAVTQFTNSLEPDFRSREVFTFHRPEELLRLVKLDAQVRANVRALPELRDDRLWSVQREAIRNLEAALADNRLRALIQMATGSGKTTTACSFCYRLIKFGKAKRILFLVDRNNLGRQTLNEFQQYLSPVNGYKFTDEFNVQHLRRNTIDPASKVCITTIQRLYSMLKGEEEYEEGNEESSMFEAASPLIKEPLPVVYNPKIPIETFDFIVIDECHRSIYNVWRQVLEYFDSFLIGLTATPTPQTIGFFNGNVVQDYSHEKAVADNVNVGYDVYRIATQLTTQGATLAKQPGHFVPHRDRRSKKKRLAELADDLTYTAADLDRDVVAENQIRLVVQTFRDRLFTEIFPGRREVPKTLVFAKNDLHAEDIVRVLRQEFGKGNDFCQKITSKTTGAKPEDLLQQFRNSYNPRIAVTVDMIATGTDVKAIECLLFMRNINSASYFEQMKGRGVRVIKSDDLKGVTPDAASKTRFVIVDAVGVCENDKTMSKPLDRQPSVPLEKLLQMTAQGIVHADLVSTLAARLARLGREMDDSQRADIRKTCGKSLETLTTDLLASIDPDRSVERAAAKFKLSAGVEPTEKQLDEVEQEAMAAALKPLHDPKLRETILAIKASLEQVIDEVTPDTLQIAGYDATAMARARSLVADFKQFVRDNKDEIEAIKLLYSKPYRAGLRYRHVRDLAAKLNRPPFAVKPDDPDSVRHLWSLHAAVEPESVKTKGGNALVDLVALVRHAIHPKEPVVAVSEEVEESYRAWLVDKEKDGVKFTADQQQWLDAIKDHIAKSLAIEQSDFDEVPFNRMGGLGKVHQLFGDRLPKLLDELNERLAA